MTNTANIRFEPSNVAYVNVDLETHEMTGGVMDETTGTFYQVGGGGGDYGDLRWVIPIQDCTLTGLETEPNIETVNVDIKDYTQSIIFNIYYTEDDVEYCDSYVCEYQTLGDDFIFSYSDDANLLTVFIENDKGTFWYGTPDHQTPYAGDYKISAVGIFKPSGGDGGGGDNE